MYELPTAKVREFQELHERCYGTKLSYDEAHRQALACMRLVIIDMIEQRCGKLIDKPL